METMRSITGSLLLMLAFAFAQALADEQPNIDQLIAEKIGRFSIEVTPYNDDCRKVYQIVEKQMYIVCLVNGYLVAEYEDDYTIRAQN